jgi:serine/threonine-protein kinase HipA
MPTSTSDIVYVWAWLPGETTPVPAGVLRARARGLWFDYGTSWLNRPGAFALGPDLPLQRGSFRPQGDLGMPGSIRDAAPDGWGRLVITDRVLAHRDVDKVDDPSLFLLESDSNRLGAIDFQLRSDAYTPREGTATLDELQQAAELIATGAVLPPQLAAAAAHGTSMGGARPKATVSDSTGEWIAKFSVSSETNDVIHAEAMGIALARRVGIDVPEFRLERSMNRDVLMTRRFDRGPDGTRRPVVSALTMLGLDEATWREGSYPALLDELRLRSAQTADLGAEIFRRVAFNIAIRNTDDHLRNHAAFWDGERLELTPAYDLSPTFAAGETQEQALAYGRDGQRDANFQSLLAVAADYRLTENEGRDIINGIVDTIAIQWGDAADEAELTERDRRNFSGWLFLNPGTLYRYSPVRPARGRSRTVGSQPRVDPVGSIVDHFDFRRYDDDDISPESVTVNQARRLYGLGFRDISRLVTNGEIGGELDDMGELRLRRDELG